MSIIPSTADFALDEHGHPWQRVGGSDSWRRLVADHEPVDGGELAERGALDLFVWRNRLGPSTR